LAADRWLYYATGGLAVAEIEASSTATLFMSSPLVGPTTSASPIATDKVRAGWVVGAGLETALASNWSLKVEYLHLDFGSIDQSITSPTVAVGFANVTATQSLHTHFTDNIVRVGLNYKFN
jgi:outer membrane immunogenic protein